MRVADIFTSPSFHRINPGSGGGNRAVHLVRYHCNRCAGLDSVRQTDYANVLSVLGKGICGVCKGDRYF